MKIFCKQLLLILYFLLIDVYIFRLQLNFNSKLKVEEVTLKVQKFQKYKLQCNTVRKSIQKHVLLPIWKSHHSGKEFYRSGRILKLLKSEAFFNSNSVKVIKNKTKLLVGGCNKTSYFLDRTYFYHLLTSYYYIVFSN